MNVALVGYAVENQATYRFYESRGIKPVICDRKPDLEVPDGATAQLGPDYLDNLDRFDVIVRSVGIHPSVILEKNPSVAPKITTAVNLFFEHCKTPIIGITGTKGKGTTSTLIHKILQEAGKKTVLAGNIGLPMLDILEEAQACDYVVLELSSFQLYDLHKSAQISVCVMVVPEHLNWHSDMDDYTQAKANLFRYQDAGDTAVFNGLNDESTKIANSSPAANKIAYGVPSPKEPTPKQCASFVDGDTIYCFDTPIMKTSEVKLLGRHNLENVCAAIAATWNIIDGNIDAIRRVVSTFSGLEYRLQKIRELNGVTYINDSFSTTPETAIAALNAFDQPKIMILGGSDKGIPLDELADAVASHNVKTVLAIGDTGPVIVELLKKRGYTNIIQDGLDSMTAIVQKAQELSEPGDVVLLSTGCASFGLFKDYKDRGKQFTDAVLALQ